MKMIFKKKLSEDDMLNIVEHVIDKFCHEFQAADIALRLEYGDNSLDLGLGDKHSCLILEIRQDVVTLYEVTTNNNTIQELRFDLSSCKLYAIHYGLRKLNTNLSDYLPKETTK